MILSGNILAEPSPEKWGGDWTKKKADIVVDYAKAYLTVMKDRKYWKLLYFDGFAGDFSSSEDNNEVYLSTAKRVLQITTPRPFDLYYFVEIDTKIVKKLEKHIEQDFPQKNAVIVQEDCNKKLIHLANFLNSRKGKDFKVLAFVDPYGMEVKWESIEALKDLPIDMWILVPTGMGINRLLKNDGNISQEWIKKLKTFLGMNEAEIKNYFYKTTIDTNLFGEETHIQKETNAIEKAATLYRNRLNEIFKHVSNPYRLKNSTGSIMFHLYMASNNTTALKIANDIIKPKLK